MHAVRAFALSSNGQKQGWLGALADPRISKALALIHAAPASPLNLEGLARHVGMSRSLFASRFMACVGTSPKQYLNAWRMHLAREALASGSTTVSALAENLGYQSESAFRTAFRKFDGRSPREYKRDAKTADG
jgi:AraC-like DNA-binding protein